MGCACKTVQQIDYLHKKYGNNLPQNKKTHIRDSIDLSFKGILLYLLVVLLLPVFVVYALIKLISGKEIRLDKFVKRKKDV